MRYFSMFSGIGGFELGIQRATLSIWNGQTENTESITSKQGMEPATEGVQPNGDSTDIELRGNTRQVSCVGYSEIDRYAIKVYERQFNGQDSWLARERKCDCSPQGGQETLNSERAGLSQINGDNDHDTNCPHTQSNTYGGHKNYGDATKIDPSKLPDFDLLVGGFPCQAFSIAGKRAGFNDTRGTLFFDIARILKEKQPRHLVLENVKGLLSHDSGRTFSTIIGVLTDLGYLVEWQVLNSKDFGVPQNRERVYIVGHLGNECGRKVFPITEHGGLPIERQRQISPTITQRYYKQGQSDPYIVSEEAESSEQSLQQKRDKPDHSDSRGGQTHPAVPRIRRLTPLECERLQGFPDDWTKYCFQSVVVRDKDEPTQILFKVSDTQRYKMCGNAVTVNVVEAVMRGLLPCL